MTSFTLVSWADAPYSPEHASAVIVTGQRELNVEARFLTPPQLVVGNAYSVPLHFEPWWHPPLHGIRKLGQEQPLGLTSVGRDVYEVTGRVVEIGPNDEEMRLHCGPGLTLWMDRQQDAQLGDVLCGRGGLVLFL